MRVFVAWDFTDRRAAAVLEGVASFGASRSSGGEVHWIVPGQRAHEEAGPIGAAIVERNIAESDMVVAFVDRANANVGWEIGLALGFGKQLRLAALSNTPAFRAGALAGMLVKRIETWQEVCQLLEQGDWDFRIAPPEAVGEVTLVLCPSGPEGSGLREAIEREGYDDVRLLEPLAEKLAAVQALLPQVRRLIWVVTIEPDEHARDGDENASNAVIAGLTQAAGWPVTVMQSTAARGLIDLAPESLEFSGIRDFISKLKRTMRAEDRPEAPLRAERQPALVIALPSYYDQQRLIGELQRVFPDRASIRQLAAGVGVEKLRESRSPDQQWGDVLRAVAKGRRDVGPLVEAGLEIEPDNALFVELRDKAAASAKPES